MRKNCWRLFISMLVLSGLTLGGGLVITPLMQRKFVEELGWLTREEILEMTAFARSLPGAVTVNIAVQVGARMAGAPGVICGVLGTVLPPLAILSGISLCYEVFSSSHVISALLYGLRLAVAVVAADAAAVMAAGVFRGGDRLQRVILCGTSLLSFTAGTGVIWLLPASALLGWILAGRNAA